jgi:hypothetical protein
MIRAVRARERGPNRHRWLDHERSFVQICPEGISASRSSSVFFSTAIREGRFCANIPGCRIWRRTSQVDVSKSLATSTSNKSGFCRERATSCTVEIAESRSSGQRCSESSITRTPASSLRSAITSFFPSQSKEKPPMAPTFCYSASCVQGYKSWCLISRNRGESRDIWANEQMRPFSMNELLTSASRSRNGRSAGFRLNISSMARLSGITDCLPIRLF